jgi:hypothetical protein
MQKERDKRSAIKPNSAQPPVPRESEQGPQANGKPPRVRTASKEEFEKAQRKTSMLHAGLFRRLAK